jgi:hypothetical protein
MTAEPNIEVFVNPDDGHNKIITGRARLRQEFNGDGQFTHVLVGDELLRQVLDTWADALPKERKWALIGSDQHTTAALAFRRWGDTQLVTIGCDDTSWMIPLDKVADALPYGQITFEPLDEPSPEG